MTCSDPSKCVRVCGKHLWMTLQQFSVFHVKVTLGGEAMLQELWSSSQIGFHSVQIHGIFCFAKACCGKREASWHLSVAYWTALPSELLFGPSIVYNLIVLLFLDCGLVWCKGPLHCG